MGEIIKNEGTGIIGLMHGSGGMVIPKPFERDIFLFSTYVAGTSHIEGIEELAPHLNIEDKLDFFRELDNYYDEKAVVIRNKNGVKIGYIPMEDNAVFSRLMDAGKMLFGNITNKEMKGKWLKLDIDIYLHE